MTVYVKRDGANKIEEIHAHQAPGFVAMDESDPEVLAFLDPSSTLTGARAKLVRSVKQEAARRISITAPSWKQNNYNSRAIELTVKVLNGGQLTPDEEAEKAEMQVAWNKIKAIRARSDALEAEVGALTLQQCATWQATGWPE